MRSNKIRKRKYFHFFLRNVNYEKSYFSITSNHGVRKVFNTNLSFHYFFTLNMWEINTIIDFLDVFFKTNNTYSTSAIEEDKIYLDFVPIFER